MKFEDIESGIIFISGSELPVVKLLPDLAKIEETISRTCEYFFKGNLVMENAPFKGFLLEGPPGTGKTEIVKQVAIKLDRRLKQVFYMFVDGASIAAPKWGDAEKKLRNVFRKSQDLKKNYTNPKLLILLDDIESLMIRRGVELAKEWHYSINSILFHELDDLNPNDTIVCATTNRPDLVDDAIRTRLYPIKAPNLSLDQLKIVVEEILNKSNMRQKDKKYIMEIVMDKLKRLKMPTIRDARQITVVECIERGMWLV